MARSHPTGIRLPELASTPANPPAGEVSVYGKTDDKVYKLLPSGVESELGGGGSKTFAFFMS